MKKNIKKGSTRKKTAGIIAFGFLALILVGTLLLMLPLSAADGGGTNFGDALFTAVSATCVTGLTVVDTATHWSYFGQTVILLLVQIGGLGFMTIAVLLSLLIKRTVTPQERMLVAMSYNIKNYEGTGELLRRIWLGTLCIEFGGAVLLSFRFVPIFGFWDGLYKSIFTSVAAFCNAGFDLFGEYSGKFSSLSAFSGDALVGIVVMLLVIIGGIGFIVWNDIANMFVRRKQISVYSRFVLIITGVLIAGGTIMYALLEWNNPATLGGLESSAERIYAALFQSVTMRTAGFTMLDQAAFSDSSKIISVILMFIGGASGSTAGGVKVATVGVLVYTVLSVAAGKKEAILFRRKISEVSFMRAVSVVAIQIMALAAGTIAITAIADCGLMEAFFESSSAIGTVGISLGLTPLLGWQARLVIMVMMYFGRVGVLTIAYAIMVSLREQRSVISYPDANILIG